jgi:hypothetical protein
MHCIATVKITGQRELFDWRGGIQNHETDPGFKVDNRDLPQKWQLRSHEHVCKLVKMTPKRYVHQAPR